MRDIVAERLVADLEAFRANVLMINAAGIIASYPTSLPFHFQSPYLTGDSLQTIIAACHSRAIRVIARTDFSKVRRPIYEAHPDWASVTAAGQIIDYNGDVQVCINGEYQQRCALEIIRELLTTHDFDGIFFNMAGYQTTDYSGNYHGICHCANCTRLFREMFRLALPRAEDRDDPVYRKYRVFQRRTVAAYREKVFGWVRALRPDICIANHPEFGQGFHRMESNTALSRPLPHWQYSASDNTKCAVTAYPAMVCSNTTVDFIDFPYRHVAVSPHQQALRLAQNLANGGALDYYLIGRLDNHADRSGFASVRELFHYHADNEAAYRSIRSKADIALLKGDGGNADEYRGWFRFFVENHYVFDAMPLSASLRVGLSKYRAVVLPDVRCVGDDAAALLDGFVEHGGTLIAVFGAGFRDGDDEPRAEPVLQSVGRTRVLHVREDTRSCYFRVDDTSTFRRFRDVDLVYLHGPYVYCEYESDVERWLRLIPPHPFGPPERCYYTEVTDHPGFTVRRFGRGRAVHVPWLPGALFHRQGHLNTFHFAADLLEGVAGLQPLGGNLPPMVEATWFEAEDGRAELLHLVNGSGHFGVSFFAPVRIGGLEVSLPADRAPATVRALVARRECEYTHSSDGLRIRVPELGLFEAVNITYE
jgi:hypothetical protein